MSNPKLLTREQFRKNCLRRDSYQCIVCNQKATYDNKGEVDNIQVHHIIERRLFVTISQLGGYFLNNGISLCDKGLYGSEGCHYKAEQTLISCDELRKLAGIETVLLPENLYKDEIYDKWANLILPNGRRTKGPLFHDESVQKVLAPVLHLFDDYVKYPRTYHLPFSPGTTKDDRVLKDCSNFFGKEVVVLTKMDGENSNCYNDYYHARSLTCDNHPSRSWMRNFHSQIKNDIPKGYRFCGENLYAKHSIEYKNLESYFYLFSIWNDKNECLSWDETVEWAELFEPKLTTVPVLYRGIWDEKLIKGLYKEYSDDGNSMEGYVVRLASRFSYNQFSSSVAKYVSDNFKISTNHHWKFQKIVKNFLK